MTHKHPVFHLCYFFTYHLVIYYYLALRSSQSLLVDSDHLARARPYPLSKRRYAVIPVYLVVVVVVVVFCLRIKSSISVNFASGKFPYHFDSQLPRNSFRRTRSEAHGSNMILDLVGGRRHSFQSGFHVRKRDSWKSLSVERLTRDRKNVSSSTGRNCMFSWLWLGNKSTRRPKSS